MTESIYLISPRSDYPTYFTLEVAGIGGPAPLSANGDLSIATVAALVPKDMHVHVCIEDVMPVDFNTQSRYIGITGKVNQQRRMRAIASEFRRRGDKVVIMGGPLASLDPDVVRDHCDILVRGELEGIAEEFFSNLKSRRWREEYVGVTADMTGSPVPRWDLLPNERIIAASVQTTRGCPHDCEYCDIATYMGRKQRRKPVSQVLAELTQLYELGYRKVFLCDDNLTANHGKSLELLEAIRDWNRGQTDGNVTFATQLSVDVANHEDLLTMCKEAGLNEAFVGIETPNVDALNNAGKRHNTGFDMIARISKFTDSALSIASGVMVGFDSDGRDIFDRHFRFWQDAKVPVLSVGAVFAPSGTRLHARLAKEGRLVDCQDAAAGIPWRTNIVPKGLSPDELMEGLRDLCWRLYHPDAFEARVSAFVRSLADSPMLTRPGPSRDGKAGEKAAMLSRSAVDVISKCNEARTMLGRQLKAFSKEPSKLPLLFSYALVYAQIRHMLQSVDSRLRA